MLTGNLSGERTETNVNISRMVFVFVSIFVCQRFNKLDYEEKQITSTEKKEEVHNDGTKSYGFRKPIR